MKLTNVYSIFFPSLKEKYKKRFNSPINLEATALLAYQNNSHSNIYSNDSRSNRIKGIGRKQIEKFGKPSIPLKSILNDDEDDDDNPSSILIEMLPFGPGHTYFFSFFYLRYITERIICVQRWKARISCWCNGCIFAFTIIFAFE
jgi:hypothetical protein